MLRFSLPLLCTLPFLLAASPRADLYGDPLPPQSILRLGTLQRRAVGMKLAVSKDGKTLIGASGGGSIRIWDAETGALRQTRELPGEATSPCVLSPEGSRLARVVFGPATQLEIWDVQTGRKERRLAIEDGGYMSLVAFSAEGRRVALMGYRLSKGTGPAGTDVARDPRLRAWDVATGKEIFAADMPKGVAGERLLFTPDGKRLLISFNSALEGTHCWDIATGRRLWQNKELVYFVPVFTSDGKLLSTQQQPRAVELATGRNADIAGLPPFAFDTRLTLAPDGRTLLLSNGEDVILWDMKERKKLHALKGAGEEIVVTPDGKAAITNSGALQRWDLATGKAVWPDTSERGHLDAVSIVRFSADGKRLVSGGADGTVRLWDATTGQPLRVWHGHEKRRPFPQRAQAGIKTLDISADGRRIVSAGTDECVQLWDADSDKEIRTIQLPPPEKGEVDLRVFQVRISSDGRRILGYFGAQSGFGVVGQRRPKLTFKLAVWDAATGSVREMRPLPLGGGNALLSPDGETLLVGNTPIDLRTGKTLAELAGMGSFGRADFSRDGALIVGEAQKITRKDGRTNYTEQDGFHVWETATGKTVARLKAKYWIARKVFHPDNRFIAFDHPDGIHLRAMHGGETVVHFPMTGLPRGRSGYTSALAFAPDGRRMATGHWDGTILLWDVRIPASSPTPLSAQELDTQWAALADDDAARAWEAVARLAESPQEALPFLRQRLKPYPAAPADETRRLLAELDDDSFTVRQAAAKRLKKLGLRVEPALRTALKARPSLEMKRRIESLLAELVKNPPSLTAEDLRQLRALIILERIATPEARRVVEEVAKGPESARLTRQARAVLDCLPCSPP